MAKKVGRPSEYSKKILEMTRKYITSCNDVQEDKENGIKLQVNLPSIEGLSLYLKVGRQRIYDWEKQHLKFLFYLP